MIGLVPSLGRPRFNSLRSHPGSRTAALATPSTSSPASKKIFIFGLSGYTAIALASQLSGEDWSVSGTYRSNGPVQQYLSNVKGQRIHKFDPATGAQLSLEATDQLLEADAIISIIPPVALPLYDPILQQQLKLLKLACSNSLTWFGYLSSTGVYGDWQGAWVDESVTPKPGSTRGYLRKEQEDAFMKLHEENGLPLHVFRLGGIYGPGRSLISSSRLQMQKTSSGDSSGKPRRSKQQYISRCHVYDVCQTLQASISRPRPGAIYNVVDNEPVSRAEVSEFVRGLMESGASSPTQPSSSAACGPSSTSIDMDATGDNVVSSDQSLQQAQSTQPSANNPVEEKRVRNTLLRSELGVELRYPSYREGMRAIHAGETAPFSTDDLEAMFGRSPKVPLQGT